MLKKNSNLVFAIGLSSLMACVTCSLIPLASQGKATFLLWELSKPAFSSLEICFIFDLYSMGFLATVGLIASSIYIFSLSYMSQEKFFLRFHFLVFSFVASMGLLILSPNLVSLLLGWDGLGVTSYLLVIYFQSSKSYNAGMVTALSNRVGDVLILLSISFLSMFASWNFLIHAMSFCSYPMIVMGILMLAACTKSAQIPFSAWLPAAMAAPTPVSSLVHSSTLVTAGVYLIFRFSSSASTSQAKTILLILGSLTMFMAGLAALKEMDMKKIVALSTLSQLGVMMLTLGTGAYLASYYHMLSHAFFKALLFMTIGAMIHMANDYQDLRKTSILIFKSPLTLAFSLGANLSLCGLPFLSGFYSKDLCIEIEVSSGASLPLTLIFYFATGLTAAYTTRLIKLILASSSKSPSLTWLRDHDKAMNSSMTVLYLFAIAGSGALSWFLFFTPLHPFLAYSTKLGVLLIIFFGVVSMMGGQVSPYKPAPLSLTFFQMWALPYITTRSVTWVSLAWGGAARALGDQLWTPQLTTSLLETIMKGSLFKTHTSAYPDLFWALSMILILVFSIFLYLCVMNFFI